MRSFIAVTAALALCLAAGAFAQTYTVLHEFAGSPEDGAHPTGGVVSDGTKFYGATLWGGADDEGTLYSMNADGSGYTVLHSFGAGNDADFPNGSLALQNGVLYGTTIEGGANGVGAIYSIKTDGSAYTVLYSFPAAPWGNSYPSPVIGSGDMLYGLLMRDPSYIGPDNWGIAYSIKTDGTGYTVLTTFVGAPDDGENPWGALLLEGGTLYGATPWGGAYYADAGTLFSLPVGGGDHTILHSFSGNDGFRPVGGLISDGSRLYGMTSGGYSYYGYGMGQTVFAVDKDGANFTTLRMFNTDAEAAAPAKGLPLFNYLATGLARDGSTLFGTNFSIGGAAKTGPTAFDYDLGTIFALNTSGTGFTTLHQFDGLIGGTGSVPVGALLFQNGTLYGVTYVGGEDNEGVVYSFTLPPPPPIDLTPNKTAFFTTDYIAVRANVAAIPTACIPFVRIIPPTGPALYCVQGQGFTTVPTPFLGLPGVVTVPSPIYDYPVFDTLFRGMPTGTYYLEGGAIDATKTLDLLAPVYVGPVDRETLVIQ